MSHTEDPAHQTEWKIPQHPWALERADGARLAPFLLLLPDGRIGGSSRQAHIRWALYGGQLIFLNDRGRPTIQFAMHGDAAGRLHGVSRDWGTLTLAPLPAPPALPQPSPDARPRRPNLVLLRAGSGSLHPHWTQDIPDADRNWDLCLSWYGDPAALPGGCEHATLARGTKFEGLSRFLTESPLAWSYEYIWLPDDDLMTGWSDINTMFALCAEYDLALAQPSLDPDCFINHPITRQVPDMVMRFSSFVEIMAPVFSRAALRVCAPTFLQSTSGYGLDHVWPRLIGGNSNRIAIIDAVSVVHTRPVGATYDLAGASAEGNAIEDAYGTFRRYQIFGYVMQEPHGFVRLRDRETDQPVVLIGKAAREVCA